MIPSSIFAPGATCWIKDGRGKSYDLVSFYSNIEGKVLMRYWSIFHVKLSMLFACSVLFKMRDDFNSL